MDNNYDDRIDKPSAHKEAVLNLLREQVEEQRAHYALEEALAESNSDEKREFRDLRRDAEIRLRALEPGL